MKNNLIIAAFILFGILALFFISYINEWDNPITGFVIENKDLKNGLISRVSEGDTTLETYLTNLGVDKIKLPDGSKDVDAIFLLSSIYMRNSGRNMRDYEILDKIKTKNSEVSYRFKAYYYEEDRFWEINYYGDLGFLKVSVCSVKIRNDGELINLDCKDRT